jgi:hypothetical protein
MKYCCKEHLTGLSRKRFEDSKAGDVTLLMHIYDILKLSKLKSKELHLLKSPLAFLTLNLL